MPSSSIEFLPCSISSDTSSSLSASSLSASVEECDRHLSQEHLTANERATWLCILGERLLEQGQQLRALSCCNEALRCDPHSIRAIAHRGLTNEHLGCDDAALIDYDLALSTLAIDAPAGISPGSSSSIEHQQTLWLLRRKGHLYRTLKHYPSALSCYNSALELDAEDAEALSGRGTVLALTGKRKQGLEHCKRAVHLAPNSPTTLNSLGIVLMLMGRYKDALVQFDQALVEQPDFGKAWNNRAIALSRLGRDAETLESLDKALSTSSNTNESWYPFAWMLKGLTQMKLGKFSQAIESCEAAQSIDPTLYGAALGKLISLTASGRIFKRILQPKSRRQLGQDILVIFNALKFRLLILAGILGLLLFSSPLSETTFFSGLRSLLPTLFSICIIGLIAADLWFHKSKIRFVWTVYFQSGALTYVRAIAILLVTLTTFAIAQPIAPAFMMWGWANAVFGQSGNIIFQPFQLLSALPLFDIYQATLSAAEDLIATLFPVDYLTLQALSVANTASVGNQAAVISMAGTLAHATFQFNLGTAFILTFWMMLILGIPFWARLEERIFRQGANSWRQICIRSTQFGLVHLLVGIPILAGFILILPGFLFACRYKYVHDKYMRIYRNPLKAQEAGTLASTADHAVYNAILVTFVAGTLAISQSLR